MTATVIRGDARSLPLPDASVDLIVTSPPYFALRSYSDGGEHYAGQIGSEPTPAEYIAALVECTREWVRVLKPSGSIFVNLGDTYASNGGASGRLAATGLGLNEGVRPEVLNPEVHGRWRRNWGVPRKSLTLLPERYRIAAVDQVGLIARAVIVWAKPNGLPESVTDRVRRSHEDWVHLTKLPRYFSAVDEIRETYSAASLETYRRGGLPQRRPAIDAVSPGRKAAAYLAGGDPENWTGNPLGKLPGSVWEIASQPLTVPAHLGVDHFAAFPMEWPRRLILGWSPSGVCVQCGEGRRPVAVDSDEYREFRQRTGDFNKHNYVPGSGYVGESGAFRVRDIERIPNRNRAITGYACACPDTSAPTRPAVVVDPFGGTGTTALVASVLGRHGISVDRSADYCRLATWRTTDPGQRAAAMQVEKPAPVMDGQMSLEWEMA